MNYHKNDLIDECLERFYTTFQCTLDTGDYVPDKYNDKILKYIFKNMKRAFKQINGSDKRWQKLLKSRFKRDKKAWVKAHGKGTFFSFEEYERRVTAPPYETQENQNLEVENNE